MKSGIAFGVLLISGILLLSQLTVPAAAQANPTATPAPPTVNPTIFPPDLEKVNPKN